MKTLIKYPVGYLNEIFQSLEIRFSFVIKEGESYRQIQNPVKCRDFLGDCIWSKKTGEFASIYGQKYDFKDTPYEEEQLQLSMTFPTKESKSNFITNIGYVRKKEKEANTNVCEILETDDPHSLILIADKVWQSCMWKISLYSFYLKVASYPNETELKLPEVHYMQELTRDKEKILLSKVHDEKEFLYDNINNAHNRHGFVSIIQNLNEKMHSYLFKGVAV